MEDELTESEMLQAFLKVVRAEEEVETSLTSSAFLSIPSPPRHLMHIASHRTLPAHPTIEPRRYLSATVLEELPEFINVAHRDSWETSVRLGEEHTPILDLNRRTLISVNSLIQKAIRIVKRTRPPARQHRFLYAVRVIRPAAFHLPENTPLDDLVSGTEVGSLLYEDIYPATEESLRKSLEIMTRSAKSLEFVFGGTGEDRSRETFELQKIQT